MMLPRDIFRKIILRFPDIKTGELVSLKKKITKNIFDKVVKIKSLNPLFLLILNPLIKLNKDF